MQEGGLLEAEIEERGLHAREHTDDATLVHVPRDAAPAPTLDVELDERRVLEERDPRLPGGDVDQDLLGHGR